MWIIFWDGYFLLSSFKLLFSAIRFQDISERLKFAPKMSLFILVLHIEVHFLVIKDLLTDQVTDALHSGIVFKLSVFYLSLCLGLGGLITLYNLIGTTADYLRVSNWSKLTTWSLLFRGRWVDNPLYNSLHWDTGISLWDDVWYFFVWLLRCCPNCLIWFDLCRIDDPKSCHIDRLMLSYWLLWCFPL